MIQIIRTSAENPDFIALIQELDKDIEKRDGGTQLRSLTKRTASNTH
jgi:hypothetical protein